MNAAEPPSDREALAVLCRALERRARELQEEVRSYPTPIARCDEQLPKLIERRGRALAQWREAVELEAGAAADGPAWSERVRRLLEDLGHADDEGLAVLAARTRTSLASHSSAY